MLRRLWVAAIPLVLASTSACRSSSEGSPAGDVAHVSSDVARRTGVAATLPACDEALRSARAALLSRPLSEEGAVKLALLGNARVRESYERLGIARADLLQSGLVSNPVFSASLKSFSAGPEVELGLAQSFLEIFFVPLRRQVAAEELCAAQAQVARELVRLVYDVRRTFVQVRGTQEVTRIRREGLAAVDAARDLMKKLHEAGNVRDADLTVEEVGAARAQMGVDAAEVFRRDAREALNVLLGLCAADAGWTIEGALPALPPSGISGAVESRALAASLDLL
jgi:outer membrane protein, heavy metal efflux system